MTVTVDQHYGEEMAVHYQAYRPPLHQEILTRCLPDEMVNSGVDIGCGTGQSALALTRWCRHVSGLEPSRVMLKHALPHPRVAYAEMNGEVLPFQSMSVDIVTFAGSWYYAKSQSLLSELHRILVERGHVICYDFSLDMSGIARILDIPEPVTDYDHTVNFDGYETDGLRKVSQGFFETRIRISHLELAHLLLAESGWREILGIKKTEDVRKLLKHGSVTESFTAQCFYSEYIRE